MTTLKITMRHESIPEDLDAHAREKLQRLDKLLQGRSPRFECTLDKEHDLYSCEMILHDASGKAPPIVSHATAPEPAACIDQAVDKCRAQLVKLQERRRDHHRGQRPGDEANAPPADEEGGEEPSYEEIVQREIKGD